jgi:hypothetical protein
VAKRLLPEVLKRLSQAGGEPYPEEETPSVLKELEGAITYQDDGYAIARNLDSWDMDADWVEFFDRKVIGLASQVKDEMEEAWMLEPDAPQPTFQVGDWVVYREEFLRKEVIGLITEYHPKRGLYTIVVPSMGQKTRAEADALIKQGFRGSIALGSHVPIEKVISRAIDPTTGGVQVYGGDGIRTSA